MCAKVVGVAFYMFPTCIFLRGRLLKQNYVLGYGGGVIGRLGEGLARANTVNTQECMVVLHRVTRRASVWWAVSPENRKRWII